MVFSLPVRIHGGEHPGVMWKTQGRDTQRIPDNQSTFKILAGKTMKTWRLRVMR